MIAGEMMDKKHRRDEQKKKEQKNKRMLPTQLISHVLVGVRVWYSQAMNNNNKKLLKP